MRVAAMVLAAGGVWLVVVRSGPRRRVRPLPPPRVIAASIASGLSVAVLAMGILGVLAPSVAAGLLATSLPPAIHASRERRRREARIAEWSDALAIVRSRLAGGSSLPEALGAVPTTGPLGGAIAHHLQEHGASAATFTEILGRLRDHLADPVSDRVLATLAAAHRTGGRRVGDILATLSVSVADELRLRSAHEAALTEQRLTAAVALVAPWSLLALTVATNPAAADAYRTADGVVVLAIGLVATLGGYAAARRTARLRDDPRVLG